MSVLVPLGGDLPEESRALAEALRRLFDGLGISVRRYAARRHRDPGSLSRFLNGTRIPPWEFVHDLIRDVAEEQGRAPTPEAIELMRRLHRTALAYGGSALNRVQALEDELADADRQSLRSAALVRALEGALADTQQRATDLELQIRQLHGHQDRTAAEKNKALQLYEDQVTALLRERQDLMEQVEALGEELKDAHARRVRAERRCEELERQLVAAEEQVPQEDTVAEGPRAEPPAADGTRAVRPGPDGPRAGAPAADVPREAPSGERAPARHGLDPRFVFETFVVGDTNRFAHGAARAVAEAPATLYNPLFVYGTSAIGKTHLLCAIGHHAHRTRPGTRVRYVTAETLAHEYLGAGRGRGLDAFRRRYLDLDLLLVDDIQLLTGQGGAHEEFRRLFDELQGARKQIVVSSDRPPKQLAHLGDRLRGRLESGLITHVQPPERAVRVTLLRRKAEQEGIDVPPETLDHIASHVQRNVRELEGALVRVRAFASLNRQPMDVQLAAIVLRDLVPDRGPSREEDAARRIIEMTGGYFGVTAEALCGKERSRALVTARQMAMYLCRELTDLSTSRIGQLFGGRDHDSVDYADRKLRALMAERRSIYNQMTELTARIKAVDGPPTDRWV
ncbi:chromosomal replication initiator protein DnaA [Streptomyces echinatus]|uniref:Chromosomal replication initiator protein DnaA n=1 Tax=Streptomyces echinatus TaxID=67293 RepID=A0A7W9PYF6_9ACTN|nr:chromosomal replication initiator protein DnaA [Streptomyces echinatus]MBB5930111.1 chromosomal replication initiator protein DnaA [Streptomyces echinatus]